MCWLCRQESSATQSPVIVAAEAGHGAVHALHHALLVWRVGAAVFRVVDVADEARKSWSEAILGVHRLIELVYACRDGAGAHRSDRFPRGCPARRRGGRGRPAALDALGEARSGPRRARPPPRARVRGLRVDDGVVPRQARLDQPDRQPDAQDRPPAARPAGHPRRVGGPGAHRRAGRDHRRLRHRPPRRPVGRARGGDRAAARAVGCASRPTGPCRTGRPRPTPSSTRRAAGGPAGRGDAGEDPRRARLPQGLLRCRGHRDHRHRPAPRRLR